MESWTDGKYAVSGDVTKDDYVGLDSDVGSAIDEYGSVNLLLDHLAKLAAPFCATEALYFDNDADAWEWLRS